MLNFLLLIMLYNNNNINIIIFKQNCHNYEIYLPQYLFVRFFFSYVLLND